MNTKQRVVVRWMLVLGLLGITGLALVAWKTKSSEPPTPTTAPPTRPSDITPSATIPAAIQTTPGASVPPKFSFVFEYGICTTNRLDTSMGTFVIGLPPGRPPIALPLVLTDSELAAIYQKMADINFFGYPTQVVDPVGPGTPGAGMFPSTTYHWVVNDGARTKEVTWNDILVTPTTIEATRLRELAKLMTQIIEARPEVRQLPNLGFGCA